MKNILLALTLITAASLSGQSFEWDKKGADAGAKQAAVLADYEAAYNNKQVGMAAAYLPGYAGRTTTYGERYLPTQFTASHSVLPLGTLVKVTDLATKKSVTVRINDKVQDCADCLITLSTSAATALGMDYRSQVTVERIGFSNWNPEPAATVANRKAAYGTGTPLSGAVVPGPEIQGEAYQWEQKEVEPAPAQTSSPSIQPTVYNAPSASASYRTPPQSKVLDKEVIDPAIGSSPADYIPAKAPTPSPDPQAAVAKTSTTQQAPGQTAPPAPTVPQFQRGETLPAPANYPTPASATAMRANSATAANTGAPVAAPAAANPGSASVKQSGHVVQLAAYSNVEYAEKRVMEFQALGMAGAFYRTFPKADGSIIHRVYSGAFATKAEAQAAADYIRDRHQLAGVVLEIE